VFVSSLRRQILALASAGTPAAEIAWRLGVAAPTVTYHLQRTAAAATGPGAATSPDPEAALRPSRTRDRVRELLDAGTTRAQIARTLGLSKPTVTYHARRLDHEIDSRCARRYDWGSIQRYHDAGHSMRECQHQFGFCGQTWTAAIKRGDLVARSRGIALGELLVAGPRRNRGHVKARLLAAGLKTGACEVCGLTTWQEAPLSLCLHHVNGDRHDNRLENLQLLCPNCHSQTDSFAGRRNRRPTGGGASA